MANHSNLQAKIDTTMKSQQSYRKMLNGDLAQAMIDLFYPLFLLHEFIEEQNWLVRPARTTKADEITLILQ